MQTAGIYLNWLVISNLWLACSQHKNLVIYSRLFITAGVTVFPGGWFGEGYGSIFLRSTNCTGEESRLLDCSVDADTSRDTHALDAALRCPGEDVLLASLSRTSLHGWLTVTPTQHALAQSTLALPSLPFLEFSSTCLKKKPLFWHFCYPTAAIISEWWWLLYGSRNVWY